MYDRLLPLLSQGGSGGGVSTVTTATPATVTITNPTGPTVNIDVSAAALTAATPAAETPGATGVVGVAPTAARADHVHALPAFGTVAGTFAQGNDARFMNLAVTTSTSITTTVTDITWADPTGASVTFPITAGKTYWIEFSLGAMPTNTSTLVFTFTLGSAVLANQFVQITKGSSGGLFLQSYNPGFPVTNNNSTNTAAGVGQNFQLRGYLVCSVSGTLTWRFSAGAGTATIQGGSASVTPIN